MVILVNDLQIYLFDFLQRMDGKFTDGLIGKEQPDLVSRDKLFRTVALFPVQRDVFLAHHLIQESLTGQIQVFGQQLIEPLARFIFSNNERTHLSIPLTWINF